jgi:DNA-binding NarL/FixJ family response regulator
MEEIPNASYAGVGRYVKRDHTTVLYAHKKGLAAPSSLEPLERKIAVHKNKSADGFSFFESEIVRLIKEGLSHVQVAKQLGKTPKQVTSALCEIRRKASKMKCTDIPPDFGRVAKRIPHD